VAAQPPAAEPPGPPRRRSTVREPAPFVIGSGEAPIAPPPPPSRSLEAREETATEADAEADSGQPRRTGWWSRRRMGGDKR
jgi:ribonuclease E